MSIAIREARSEDRPALVRLMGALHEFEAAFEENRAGAEAAGSHLAWVEKSVAELGGVILVAETGGRVSGFVAYTFEEDPGTFVRPEYRQHALIWDISVAEEARGQGIGQALLQAAEEAARRAGIREMRLYVLEANTRARRIYEEAGYRNYERFLSKRL
ncbi:MAG: GNAT family N-acetyltransferase [Alphaproteobacteria bacterium]|nr:GNAT family N-acetyltransferase [Alphaproteobacteria bacterium]MDX5417553.1 GNAT family N-acetyltransferase [Alphaproteobacteria bacterium]MDX5495037.1 GNAT family N-acetyltransferase [Alphaproteobacteria bacterium]